MKRTITFIAFAILFGLALWKCSSTKKPAIDVAASGNTLPQDACKTCVVDSTTFKSWFVNANTSNTGIVTAANSVAFAGKKNCDFYRWSEQMFLWITSPLGKKDSTVLSSNIFFNVSPPNTDGSLTYRTLIPHTTGNTLDMSSHIVKFGPDRLPVVKDKTGHLVEIEKLPAKPTVKDENGAMIEVGEVRPSGNTFAFIDKTGKAIANPHAAIKHAAGKMKIAHLFRSGKKFVLLDGAGNIVESEEGQATGNALMAQGDHLVYYLVLVNDVYVQYLNLAKSNPLFRQRFPTTAAERHAIVAYAKKNNATLPDSNALAMELKSSWVETSTLGKDSTNYFLVTATIPVYNQSVDSIWTPTGGRKTARMALVGMHVVGSVAGHPEMIWATFEHQNNTPNASYFYLKAPKDSVKQAQDSGSGWVFTSNAADTAPNKSRITTNDPRVDGGNGPNTDTLFANAPFHKIGADNILRTFPWGSAPGTLVNPEDKSAAASNTQVISINNSIRSQLAANDIRRNYIFIGATWTGHGTSPNQISYGADTSKTNTPSYDLDTVHVAIGTSILANSTMETFFQGTNQSCFTCHSGNQTLTLKPDTISHVFTEILPYLQTFKPPVNGTKTINNKKKK